MSELRLDHVSYKYGSETGKGVMALNDVSLTISDGMFLGLAGMTGSGKTTLVKILKGLLEPTSGSVSGDRSKVGLVFQYPESQLFEETVLKDVMFGPINQGLSEEQARAKAQDAMALVGLDQSFEDRSPFGLSGGEKRRAAIAGVLAMEPDVLVLDEPAAGLDRRMHDALFSLLQSLNSRGKTIIVVSHDMDDIATYCSHVAYLGNGKLQAFGKPGEALSEVGMTSFWGRIADRLRTEGIAVPENVCSEKDLVDNL